jgi:hypothetical protein
MEKEIITINNTNFFLSSLCYRKHNWNNTGKSLRYLKGGVCVECSNLAHSFYSPFYEEKNKEKIKEYHKKHGKIYNQKHEIQKRKKEWNLINSEKLKNYHKKRNANPLIKKQINLQRQIRYRKDENYKLYKSIRKFIFLGLKENKKSSVKNLLDFTFEELKLFLKNHLSSIYTWQDYLDGILELDHIIPMSWFSWKYEEDEEFKLCFQKRNFQLLSSNENRCKSSKYAGSPKHSIINYEEFEGLINLFPIKLVCNCILNEYWSEKSEFFNS